MHIHAQLESCITRQGHDTTILIQLQPHQAPISRRRLLSVQRPADATDVDRSRLPLLPDATMAAAQNQQLLGNPRHPLECQMHHVQSLGTPRSILYRFF